MTAAPNHTVSQLIQQAVALLQVGKTTDGIQLLETIYANFQGNFEAISAIGNIAGDAGDYPRSLKYYETALKLNPHSIECRYYQGVVQQKMGLHEDAVKSFEFAISKYPNLFEALHDCANSLRELKQSSQALKMMDKALSLRPSIAQAHYNRALILEDLKKYDEAMGAYDAALKKEPNFVGALINSAVLSGQTSRISGGLSRIHRALAIDPNSADALFVRAELNFEFKKYAESETDYQSVLRLNSAHAPALNGLARLYMANRQHVLAKEHLEKLLAVAPDFPYGLGNLIHTKMMCCDWSSLEDDISHIKRALKEKERQKCITPFILLGLTDTPELHRTAAEVLVSDAYKTADEDLTKSIVYEHQKIKVAYVSADFHEHATALLMAGVFEHHDNSRFEVIAISHGPDDGSEMRKRLIKCFSNFIDVSQKPDKEVALLIRSLEIDIAIDLKGHTTGTRLGIFAYRPAPIQVSYLGYPGTTAAPYLDYVLADRHVIPEELQQYYTEKVVYLPNTYQANDAKREIETGASTRSENLLPEDAFVFGSFNNSFKIIPATFNIWMNLLKKTPHSVLWLLATSEEQKKNIQSEAENQGVSGDRIIFAPRLRPKAHLRRLQLVDLYLDNFPYNAHTSASDALWVGVPVLTYQGVTFASRVASSLLHAVGLPDLVCTTLEQYETHALEIAHDPTKLAALKTRLAVNRSSSPLFDTARFTRNLERSFEKMVERHVQGLSPIGFTVEEGPATLHQGT